MAYLELFNNYQEYEAYSGTSMIRPNVSHCVQENYVFFNPNPKCITFNITCGDMNIDLLWDGREAEEFDLDPSNIMYVDVDGQKFTIDDMNETTIYEIKYYSIPINEGNHIIKYYLNDDTVFNYFLPIGTKSYVNTIIVPSTVKEIVGEYVLQYNESTNIIINVFNLEYVVNRAFGCNFVNFTQEEQEYITSICPTRNPSYCK